jgi:hypothetical protein
MSAFCRLAASGRASGRASEAAEKLRVEKRMLTLLDDAQKPFICGAMTWITTT